MRMRAYLTGALAVALVTMTAACNSGSDDNSLRDLTLLYLLSNESQTSALTLQQQQATTAASAATSAAGSATTSAGMTASNDHSRVNKMVAGYLKNGKDPVYMRTEMKKYFQAKKAKAQDTRVELAAVTKSVTSGATGSGTVTYSYSGTIDGIEYKEVTADVSAYSPYINDSCLVTGKMSAGTKGTATFSNGSLAYTGSGSGSSFSGNSTNQGDIAFSDFGLIYYDYYSLITFMKSNDISVAITDCPSYQKLAELMNNIMVYSVINGNVNYLTTSSYSGNYSSGYSSNSNYSTTLNSTGLIMDGTTHTLGNLKYSQTSNMTYSLGASTGTGSFTIAITGTLDGSELNETLTITF